MKGADLLSFGAYEFECAVRASTVIGAGGGGGLGGKLLGSLAAMDFPRVTTKLIVLVIVVAALDQFSLHLRRCSRGLLLPAPLGAYAAIHYSPQLLGAAARKSVVQGRSVSVR